MPFKFHASRRHHIPRAKYRVMNWPDYDRGLVRRGDIRFWIDESALEQWDAAKRRTPGGQRRFSELAISTALMLGVVFRLPLRQTEGFVRSLVDLMGCDLPVPDHTTLSRRRRTVDVVVETSTNKRSTDIVLDSTGLKFFGAGEWARAKHGETRRSWRKLHISVDPASSEIRTHELTGDDTADATMAGPLVAGSGGTIRRVFADGAYDGEPVTKAIREARPPNSPPEIIIPPRATSIPPPDTPHGGSEREHHEAEIASKGMMNWQKRQGYGLRALGETAMARVKRLNGGKLNAAHIPIPTNRNRHADRRTQSLYPCGKTKHNQDPLTNRGMGDHTIVAPCTKALSCRKFRHNAVRLQLHALAYNLGNFMRTLVLPDAVEQWSLTTLREKLVKIGAKIVRHGRYIVFQMAEVAIPRDLFADILRRIDRLRTRPLPT